jgi:transposase-like protein
MDRENLQETTTVLKKRKGYSLKFKQKALEELANNNRNFQNTAQRLNIPRQCLMRWFKQKDQIEEAHNKIARQRLTNGTSRAFYPEMEQSLEQWIREERAKGVSISGFLIKAKAVEIMRTQISGSTSTFKASNGWLANFLKRKNLTLREVEVGHES